LLWLLLWLTELLLCFELMLWALLGTYESFLWRPMLSDLFIKEDAVGLPTILPPAAWNELP
jgi:hypothetical protein